MDINGMIKMQIRPKMDKMEVKSEKIANFEANFPFGTMQIHKWMEKMVVQTKKYQTYTLKGIGGS